MTGMQQDLFAVSPAPAPDPLIWKPTREAGLNRLQAFAPLAGRAYARDRNIDRGPQDRSNISLLSPWIRRRMITEEEVIAAVLRLHGFAAAEKFIQEVFWRTYWKGWLELRPATLASFNAERRALQAELARDGALRARVEAATQAASGISCFDAWVSELRQYGWIHNHARMWFASIWIFTLRLPWQLGADFMFKHLLDADPASNTLSWRWVAGLQTPGKHYVARASNIREKTLGRFNPEGLLDENPACLTGPAPQAPARALGPVQSPREGSAGLLLHEDDLHPESLAIGSDIKGVCALRPVRIGDMQGPAMRFGDGALEDALARAGKAFAAPADQTVGPAGVISWAKALGVREVITPYAPVGLTAWTMAELAPVLAREGIRMSMIRRTFDERAWPHARAGFFKFRERIPDFLACMAAP